MGAWVIVIGAVALAGLPEAAADTSPAPVVGHAAAAADRTRWYVDLAVGVPVVGTASGVSARGALDRGGSPYVTLRAGWDASPSWALEAFAVSSQQYAAADSQGRAAGLLIMGAGVGAAWTTPWSRRVSLAFGAGIGLPPTSEASATVYEQGPFGSINQAEDFANAAAPLIYGEGRWEYPRGPWSLGLRAGVRMGVHVGPRAEAVWNSTTSRFESGGFIVDLPVSAALRYRF